MQDETLDVIVIGAGVVGLACAASFARRGDRVLVLERNPGIAQETSSRNSGVVHAGLYYPKGSLKATLCVRGRELLYARAQREGLAHRKLGKLVVAAEASELAKLEQLHDRALQNGAGAVQMLDAAQARSLEPRVRAHAALFSPETGIVDAHELSRSYWNEAARHDALRMLHTQVTSVQPTAAAFLVRAEDDRGDTHRIEARCVINAAGLYATQLAQLAGLRFATHLCKGDYFAVSTRLRGCVSRLVYPIPVQAGLGIHLTLDLAGALRVGPDTQYVDAPGFDVDERKRSAFATAVRRYLPELRDDDLTPDYSGLRPKLHGPETSFQDFVITESPARYVHLLGIESPGLTASEAIAEHVLALIPR